MHAAATEARGFGSLRAGFTAVVSCLTWVPGTELRASAEQYVLLTAAS